MTRSPMELDWNAWFTESTLKREAVFDRLVNKCRGENADGPCWCLRADVPWDTLTRWSIEIRTAVEAVTGTIPRPTPETLNDIERLAMLRSDLDESHTHAIVWMKCLPPRPIDGIAYAVLRDCEEFHRGMIERSLG